MTTGKYPWYLKHGKALLISLGLFMAQPALAVEQMVTVVFRTPPEKSLVEVMDKLFLTSHERLDESTYRFKLPPLKTAQDFAELYASFSYVAKTQPAPKYNIADHINPQVVNMRPVTGAQGSPQPQVSPPPQSDPPNPTQSPTAQPLPNGTMAYTQIPLDGGGQIQVDFKPATPEAVVRMFEIVFETEEVEKLSFYSYRLQLPPHMNYNRAVRIMRLCPHVLQAQRLYS